MKILATTPSYHENKQHRCVTKNSASAQCTMGPVWSQEEIPTPRNFLQKPEA